MPDSVRSTRCLWSQLRIGRGLWVASALLGLVLLLSPGAHAQVVCNPLRSTGGSHGFLKVADLAVLNPLIAADMNDSGEVAFLAGLPGDPNNPTMCVFRWGGGDAQALLCEEPWRCAGGGNPGTACVSSTECTGGGVCSPNRCLGGATPGIPCFGPSCGGTGVCAPYPFIDTDAGWGLVAPEVAINNRGVIAFAWNDRNRGSELYRIPPGGPTPTRVQDRLDISNEVEAVSLSDVNDAVGYTVLTRGEVRRTEGRRCDGSPTGALCTTDADCTPLSCQRASVTIASSDSGFPDPDRRAFAGQFPVIEHDSNRVFAYGQLLSTGQVGVLAGDGGPLQLLAEVAYPRFVDRLNSEGQALITDGDIALLSPPLIRRTSGGSESIVTRGASNVVADLAGCHVVLDRIGACPADSSPCSDDDECTESFPGAGDDVCGLGGFSLLFGLWQWQAGSIRNIAEPGVTPILGATYMGMGFAPWWGWPLRTNRAGLVLTTVSLDDGRNLLIRADPPGSTSLNPIMPSNPGVPCSAGCQFQLAPGGPLGVGGTGLPIFIDPVVAVGYDYTVADGDPLFASVLVPEPLPGGDADFELEFAGNIVPLSAGVQFDITGVVPTGVAAFAIRGIDPGEGLDPTDPLAFVTGLTFMDADPDILVTMTAIELDTGEDGDGDGVPDASDNCPAVSNASQLDSGGIDTLTPDGIGDACQCGDVTDEGLVQINDATIIKRAILGLGPGLTAPRKCNVIGITDPADGDSDGLPDDCAINDATVVKRAILDLGPGIGAVCAGEPEVP